MSLKHRKKHEEHAESQTINDKDQAIVDDLKEKKTEESSEKAAEPGKKESEGSREEAAEKQPEGSREEAAERQPEESETEPEERPDAKTKVDFSAAQAERRQYRKKRRMRNQILAYAVLVVLIGLIAAGTVAGIKYLTTVTVKEEETIQQSKEQQSKEQQEKVEEIFASEESIVVPESSELLPVVVEPTYEEKLDELVSEIIAQMSLEDRVAGLFFATPENITKVSTAIVAGERTKAAMIQYPVGGLIYQSKNIQNEGQIKELLSTTSLYAEESANHNIFLAVSEEGGDAVAVAAKGLGSKVDSAAAIGASQDVENAKAAGNTIGEYLNQLGFNLDFAPVADLDLVDNSAVGKRSYGSEASAVSGFVTAMMQGLDEKGILPAVIQFPGTGSTKAKTENGLASSDRSAEEFRANEFAVFAAAIENGAQMIMVSHMSAPSLDESNVPCSMSETVVTGILRRELGFQGVIISEAMNKKAVSDYYASDEAAINALKAGCDMILSPEDFELAFNGVLEAVKDGRISEERINDSLKRVYRIKYADKIEKE